MVLALFMCSVLENRSVVCSVTPVLLRKGSGIIIADSVDSMILCTYIKIRTAKQQDVGI